MSDEYKAEIAQINRERGEPSMLHAPGWSVIDFSGIRAQSLTHNEAQSFIVENCKGSHSATIVTDATANRMREPFERERIEL